jgi:hypothetical protein
MKSKSKYGNRRVKVDHEGTTLCFDSRKEYARWQLLSVLHRSGDIQDLQRQVAFVLSVNGVKIGKYIADFTYTAAGERIVEDVKSEMTRKLPMYRWKRKHMEAEHGIIIQEV